jgi:hypothetical protein
VAPPVFKTGLAANIVAGGFDSLPPPPPIPAGRVVNRESRAIQERGGNFLKRLRVAIALAIPLLWLASWLSGCYVSQLSPTTYIVTDEPDGGVVRDECVTATQIAFSSLRLECQENRVQVIEECDGGRCTYTRNGKVFRDCKITSHFSPLEYDCIENGVHIKRQCDRGWSTTTCYETKLP